MDDANALNENSSNTRGIKSWWAELDRISYLIDKAMIDNIMTPEDRNQSMPDYQRQDRLLKFKRANGSDATVCDDIRKQQAISENESPFTRYKNWPFLYFKTIGMKKVILFLFTESGVCWSDSLSTKSAHKPNWVTGIKVGETFYFLSRCQYQQNLGRTGCRLYRWFASGPQQLFIAAF